MHGAEAYKRRWRSALAGAGEDKAYLRPMRGLTLGLVLASVSVLVGASFGDAGMTTGARVRILDTAPLELRGSGFEPGERVRLKVSHDDRVVTRKVRAGEGGGFTTSFLAVRYGRCGGSLRLVAVGTRGSRVSWELVPLECPDRADS